MTFQEIVRKIPYLSIRERKILLKLIADSLNDPQKSHGLPHFEEVDAEEADETEPQEYINQPRDEQDYE